MGSWNETCFVSNLSIMGGDRCVAVVVGQSPLCVHASGSEGGIGFYPMLPPFRGTYSDYGSLEIDDASPVHQYNAAQLSRMWEEKTLCLTNSGIDFSGIESQQLPSDRSTASAWMEAIERHYIERTLPESSSGSTIRLALAHEEFFDLLVNRVSEDDEVEFYSKKSILEGITKEFFTVQLNDPVANRYLEASYSALLDHFKGVQTRRRTAEILPTDLLQRSIIAEELANVVVVDLALTQLRRCWYTGQGRGSQDDNRKVMKALNEAVNRHIDVTLARDCLDEDNDEESLD